MTMLDPRHPITLDELEALRGSHLHTRLRDMHLARRTTECRDTVIMHLSDGPVSWETLCDQLVRPDDRPVPPRGYRRRLFQMVRLYVAPLFRYAYIKPIPSERILADTVAALLQAGIIESFQSRDGVLLFRLTAPRQVRRDAYEVLGVFRWGIALSFEQVAVAVGRWAAGTTSLELPNGERSAELFSPRFCAAVAYLLQLGELAGERDAVGVLTLFLIELDRTVSVEAEAPDTPRVPSPHVSRAEVSV